MKRLKGIYLSLGSNLGDKKNHLQQAVDQLQEHIGNIITCSSVYRSSSWGFKSDNFFNICLSMQTLLAPKEAMEKILQIEEQLGRIREKKQAYLPRTIDIDIIFYDNEVYHCPEVTIPHPRLHLRRFVLEPLAAIAPEKIHPVLDTSVVQLLKACKDKSPVKKTIHRLCLKHRNDFSECGFMTIEGNIGSGKTTLASKMANDFGAKLILEHFSDNPFLSEFYKDSTRYALAVELAFLADRYRQFTDAAQNNLFGDFVISDYHIYKSLIFARINLQDEEVALYRQLFDLICKKMYLPDRYIYLYQRTGKLLENIRKRGRSYEQHITASYLEAIHKGYQEFFSIHPELQVLFIDISDMDILKNEDEYQDIICKIHAFFG